MSGRSRRSNPNIYSVDYKTYHRTGNKVFKPGSSSTTDMADVIKTLQIREKQIADDINEFFHLSDLEDLRAPEEISDALVTIAQLGKDLRHLHISLKDEMGDEQYAQHYVDFDALLEKVRSYQKDGKRKLRDSSQQHDDELLQTTLDAKNAIAESQTEERKEANVRVRDAISVEEEVFCEKLALEMDELDSDDVVSLERYCVRLENLLDSYFSLISRAKIAFSQDYDSMCKVVFEDTVAKIRDQIKLARKSISELALQEKRRLVIEQETRERIAADSLKKEQIAVAHVVSQEIVARSSAIIKKCDWRKLDDFDDYKILDCSKNLSTIDSELLQVFSKYTEFSKIVSLYCNNGDQLVAQTLDAKQSALDARNSYAQKLYDITVKRDISEEKLKKSSKIPIELPKFKGYDSKLDIYTFRSEFEKVIQPTLQKIYWLDALRNNFLTGPAFTLVEKTETIDEAWNKLLNA